MITLNMKNRDEKSAGSYGSVLKCDSEEYRLKAFISPHNKRIRVISYDGPNFHLLLDKIDSISEKHDFATKIMIKVRERDFDIFEEKGYEKEAVIKDYFNGEDCFIYSKFLTEERRFSRSEVLLKEEEIMGRLEQVTRKKARKLPDGYEFFIAGEKKHFEDLAGIYKKVFASYPFPIFDPDYLEKTSRTHIIYGIIYNDKGYAVGAASAETDSYNNAEMTDFATLPSERGKGLASILLEKLEKEAEHRGVKNFYTIARSMSPGMNSVFKKAGYKFMGKLINNCNICGDFENMGVWCRV